MAFTQGEGIEKSSSVSSSSSFGTWGADFLRPSFFPGSDGAFRPAVIASMREHQRPLSNEAIRTMSHSSALPRSLAISLAAASFGPRSRGSFSLGAGGVLGRGCDRPVANHPNRATRLTPVSARRPYNPLSHLPGSSPRPESPA
jgi:hypothetical protein